MDAGVRRLLVACAAMCVTQSGSAAAREDPSAIVHLFEAAYAKAWNAADAAALTRLFAPDVTIHTVSGKLLRGRDTILADSRKRYADYPHPPAIRNLTDAVEQITPDVIATQGRSEWADGSHFIFTKVLRRDAGQWRLVAMQVARPAPMALSK